MKPADLIVPIALVVVLVWAIAAMASLVLHDYSALTIVTPVMLIVAGALFGFRVNGHITKEKRDYGDS